MALGRVPGPHFSQAFYCSGGSGHVYCVAIGRAPRRTVEYACGALGRAPCIHARLRRLATKSDEKCGLSAISISEWQLYYFFTAFFPLIFSLAAWTWSTMPAALVWAILAWESASLYFSDDIACVAAA